MTVLYSTKTKEYWQSLVFRGRMLGMHLKKKVIPDIAEGKYM